MNLAKKGGNVMDLILISIKDLQKELRSNLEGL
jgi:hypothetical protein